MRTLAIETATEACSIALFDGDELVARQHEEIGRGHAEHLIPMIEGLPDNGKADRILVSLGPGSFTGVRIGIATARALGFAWGAKVLGYPTLALVAERAAQSGQLDVTVCMNGGHGEWFVQNFAENGSHDTVQSLKPEEAKAACRYDLIAGNRAQQLAAMFDGSKRALGVLPDAALASCLPVSLLSDNLSPVYGRAPDAKPAKEQIQA